MLELESLCALNQNSHYSSSANYIGEGEGQFEFKFDVRHVTNADSLYRCDFSSKLTNVMISMLHTQPAKLGPVVRVTLSWWLDAQLALRQCLNGYLPQRRW